MPADALIAGEQLEAWPIENFEPPTQDAPISKLETQNDIPRPRPRPKKDLPPEPSEEKNLLSDLPTMDIDTKQMERVVRSSRDTDRAVVPAAEQADPEPELEDPPAIPGPMIHADLVTQHNYDDPMARGSMQEFAGSQKILVQTGGSKVPWLLTGMLGLLLVAVVAVGLYVGKAREMQQRAERLDQDVQSALASTLPVSGDAKQIAALRAELTALQEAMPEHKALQADLRRARGGIATLEGLLGLTGAETKLAEEALGGDALTDLPACRSALLGGLATLRGDEQAILELTSALEHGVKRAELHAWRVQARLQDGLREPAQASAALEDLEVLAKVPGGLRPAYLKMKAHAELALGRLDAAAATLQRIPEPPADMASALALARVERSLQKGTPRQALADLDLLKPGEDAPLKGPRAQELAKQVLARAQPKVEALAKGKLSAAEQALLLDLLRLAHRLSGQPLPKAIEGVLLEAAREGARKRKIPTHICLALGALTSKATRREVLVLVFRRLLGTRSPTERVELNFLLCLMVGIKVSGDLSQPQQLLGGLRDPETQVELYLARAMAWESYRRYRRALADVHRALKLQPKSPDLLAAKKQIVKKLRADPSGRGRRRKK